MEQLSATWAFPSNLAPWDTNHSERQGVHSTALGSGQVPGYVRVWGGWGARLGENKQGAEAAT